MKKNKKNKNFNINNDLSFDESVNNINKILNGDNKIAIAEDYDFNDKSLEEEISNEIDLVLSLDKNNEPEYVYKRVEDNEPKVTYNPVNVLKEEAHQERNNDDNTNNSNKHDTKEQLMTFSDFIKSTKFLGVININDLDDQEFNEGDEVIIEIRDEVDGEEVYMYNISIYDGTEFIKIGDLDLEDFLDEDDLEDDDYDDEDDDDLEDWENELSDAIDIDSEFDKLLIEDIDDDDDDELLDIEDADDESLDIEEGDDVIEEDVKKEEPQTSVEETPQTPVKEEPKSIATDVDTSSEKKDVADVISFKEKKDEKEFQEFREELAEKVLDTIDEVASGNITDDEYEELLNEKEEDYSQYMKSNRKQSPQKMKNSKKDKSDDWVVPKRK